MILEVEGIHTYYGLSHIIAGVSLEVGQGEIVCLLGRNGAGKTTTLRSILGLTPPRVGNIRFKGQEITGWSPHRVNRAGIGYVPENRRIFADLTVSENLDVAQKRTSERNQWTIEKIYELFPVLKARRNQLGGLLSGGEQQMLAVARALVGNPELILMDEVTEGLSPIVVEGIEEQLLRLKEVGVSILLSMQDVIFAMNLSEKAYIIEKGEIKYHSMITELRENESVVRKYLTL